MRQVFGPDLDQARVRLREFLQSLGVKTDFADYGVDADEAQAMIAHALQGARGKNFIGARAV
ncbi:hypothetical protein D3C76_1873660 [compost metagenome]